MSKERMDQLLEAIHGEGWEVENSTDLYGVENEVVTWKLVNRHGEAGPFLDFHLFGDLGQRTEDLNDILYCVIRDHGEDFLLKIYFAKISATAWTRSVRDFVIALRSFHGTRPDSIHNMPRPFR